MTRTELPTIKIAFLGCGGIVIDGGAHSIRPLRMWLGEIDEVVDSPSILTEFERNTVKHIASYPTFKGQLPSL